MIRRLLSCLIVWMCFISANIAQSPQARFDDALNSSASGDNIAAYDSLRAIESEGYISGELYYNMGVIAAKLDSLSVAKLYFIAASRYRETRQLALDGVQYVDSRFPQKVAELPLLPWEQFFDWLVRTFGINLLYWSVVIIANIGVLLYMLGWYVGRPRWLRGAYISAALYVVTFLTITLYIDAREQRYDDAVIIQGQYALKDAPDSNAAVVSQAYEGFSFTVDGKRSAEHPGWLYVRMSNGLYGWLPDGSVRTI